MFMLLRELLTNGNKCMKMDKKNKKSYAIYRNFEFYDV